DQAGLRMGLDEDGAARVLRRDGGVLLTAGTADPHGVVQVFGEPGQGGHEPTGAPSDGATGGIPVEADRTAVGQEHERQVEGVEVRHGGCSLLITGGTRRPVPLLAPEPGRTGTIRT